MRSYPIAVACGLVLWTAASLQAADMKEAAREAAAQAAKSVITIRVVSTMKVNVQGQDREQEQKSEVPGVVVDASGLAVTCASLVDPSRQRRFPMKVEFTVKETTFILPDGTETAAEMVLTDTDLDLAFLRPKEAGKPFDAVELKPRTGPPKLLDDVFTIGRLGKEGNRALRVISGAIQSEVKGPRPFYVCSAEMSRNLGCLVYAADGGPLGILVTKASPPEETGRGGMMSMGGLAVLRPVGDLLDAIKQAKEVKPKPPEEKKAESPKPEEKKTENPKPEEKKP